MFQCRDLLTLPSMEKSRIIAGKDGLNRGIRWAYKAESMEFSRWVHGQELLIVSTPVIRSPEFDLLLLVKRAAENQMSGVLLLAGEDYVKQISGEVLRFCSIESFPIIAIPWNIPLLDIFEELGHAIAYHDHLQNNTEDLLSGIIFGNHVDEDVIRMQGEMIGYDISPPQAIFAVHFFKEEKTGISMTQTERETAVKTVSNAFYEAGIPVLISCYGNQVVGMYKAEQGNEEDVLVQSGIDLHRNLNEYSFHFGCGRKYNCLGKLKESFQEASKCIALGKRLRKKDEVFFWGKPGLYHLLMEFDNREPFEQFCRSVIGGILSYDCENNAKLFQTLDTYLEQNCSLKHTAEILYTHRNTVKYRIQRIQEITGKSLDRSFDRLELHNAVLIWKFCQ